jgi:hypothetical protein
MSKHPAARHSEIGCRIPKEYFWVIGWEESDAGIETGSYDAALHMAGIENYNVMLYTSVLPPEMAVVRRRRQGRKPKWRIRTKPCGIRCSRKSGELLFVVVRGIAPAKSHLARETMRWLEMTTRWV